MFSIWQKHHEYFGYEKSIDYEMLKTSAGKYSSCESKSRFNGWMAGGYKHIPDIPCALRAQDMPACNWNGTN